MRLEVPPPLAIDWEMKDPTSAETEIVDLPDGRREVHVRHAPLAGVTPAMLVWWFRFFHGTLCYRGETIPMYRLWHPRDHIRVRVLRPPPDAPGIIAPGAVIEICERIVEPRRAVARVVQLDETRVALRLVRGGLTLVEHTHNFTATPDGTRDHTKTVIGSTIPGLGRVLTRLATTRLFTPPMIRAYLKHAIEEVGNFEFFLPALYAQRKAAVPEL